MALNHPYPYTSYNLRSLYRLVVSSCQGYLIVFHLLAAATFMCVSDQKMQTL